MTIKVKHNECCTPPEFEPYTITLHVDNIDDHYALKYLSFCNAKVPQTLYDRAQEGFRGGKYQIRATQIKKTMKAFLMELAAKLPARGDCND